MGSLMDWMFMFFQNLFVEIPTPKVMVLGSGAFGKWLGHESGHLTNRTGALITETTESSQPLCHVRTQWEEATYEPRGGLLVDIKCVDAQFWTF